MFGLGIGELLLIAAFFVLVFGAKKIPLMAKGLGQGIRNFKGELKNPDRDENGDDPSD